MSHPEPPRNLNRTRRYVVQSRDGLVVAGHPLAASAGAGVLLQGGNAADAAVATGLALAVLRPQMCGLGGDLFAQVYRASDRSVSALNANGPAPAGATLERFRSGIPREGPLASTVPGAVAGWGALHRRFGSLPWRDLHEPAIRFAERGFPAYPRLVRWIEADAAIYRRYPSTAEVFLPRGAPPITGSIFCQPALAATLRLLAAEGPDAFYRGDLARRLAAAIQGAGGLIDQQDLAALEVAWLEPLRTTYRGLTVCEQPPTSQGYLVLETLNLLEAEDLRALGRGSAATIDRMVEAKRRVFAERDRVFGDPAFVEVPLAELLDKEHAARLRAGSAPASASGWADGETTCFAIVDRAGNGVVCIQSHFHDSGFVAGDTGVLMNGRLQAFSLDPSSPNAIAPGKRPVHTLNTWLVLDGDRLRYLGGSPGAHGQVQTNVQVLTGLIDFGLEPQEAVEAPRWVHGDTRLGGAGEWLALEARFPADTVQDLRARGYVVELLDDWAEMTTGSAKVIAVEPNGVLTAGVDPRRDAYAIGL